MLNGTAETSNRGFVASESIPTLVHPASGSGIEEGEHIWSGSAALYPERLHQFVDLAFVKVPE
jgi:hypothetical protein